MRRGGQRVLRRGESGRSAQYTKVHSPAEPLRATTPSRKGTMRRSPPAETSRKGAAPMNPIVFALRRPLTVMVLVAAVALGSGLALLRMPIDIFPNLNLPIIYVAQPYGGMDPAQMEGLLTNYYEYHFLYITGIHHVESKNIQGVALMKLFFHPGTDMSQAMAETIGYVTRSRAFMPPGTVS